VIQKKICLIGVFATGKTSLVRQFVHSMFSEKYHSTIGVKIDRKRVEVGGEEVNMVLWDLAGRDGVEDIQQSYLRGASGILYVVDGTRRETFDQLSELRDLCTEAAGEVPSVVALNKSDLASGWRLTGEDERRLDRDGIDWFTTSAKLGDGVDEAFHRLAAATLTP
jgi:small GTP-binding protein